MANVRHHDENSGWKQNLSSAMERSAEIRKCPACHRKGALKETVDRIYREIHNACRWCSYHRITDMDTGETEVL